MSRPDTITVRTTNPHIPGFAVVASVGYHDLSNITMSRHPEDQDAYRVSAGVFTSQQMAMNGLIDLLLQNGIQPVVTHDTYQGEIDYIATVVVKGKEAVDKLIALSKRSTSAEQFIGKKEGGGPAR